MLDLLAAADIGVVDAIVMGAGAICAAVGGERATHLIRLRRRNHSGGNGGTTEGLRRDVDRHEIELTERKAVDAKLFDKMDDLKTDLGAIKTSVAVIAKVAELQAKNT